MVARILEQSPCVIVTYLCVDTTQCWLILINPGLLLILRHIFVFVGGSYLTVFAVLSAGSSNPQMVIS